jgi:hypothetical protein
MLSNVLALSSMNTRKPHVRIVHAAHSKTQTVLLLIVSVTSSEEMTCFVIGLMLTAQH